MYRQIYTLPFQSIEENDYLVVIEKDGFTGTSTKLTGSTSPFVVETSLDSPLSPYRLSTATLKIFGGDYLQNLFTPNPQGVRVKLLKNNVVEWIGFVTNDTYSQDYSSIEFEYEIELVNPLSTLKYKKFVLVNNTVTFYELIVDAIKETNSEIKKLYLPTSITNELNQNIYEILSTSSVNYIDEQDEKMTYYEILEEIAKYLSLTITIDKDTLYFIDYIGISKEYNDYYEYTIDSNYTFFKNYEPVTLSNSNTIQLLDYAGDSSTLQINSGKNKAKVTCSLYDIDENIFELTDEESEFRNLFKKEIQLERKNSSGGKDWGTKHCYLRTFKHPKYTFYRYKPNTGNTDLILHSTTNESLSLDEIGSGFVRYTDYETWWGVRPPNKLDFSNEILVKTEYSENTNNNLTLSSNNPIVTLEKDVISIPNIYFVISVDFKPMTDNWYIKEPELNITSNGVSLIMKAKLRIKNLYWNGSIWTTTESTFIMRTNINKDDKLVGQYHTNNNSNSFETGTPNLSGYLIPSPPNIIIGNMTLTLYSNDEAPAVINTFGLLSGVRCKYLYYKDISVKYGIPNDQSVYGDWKDTKSDVTYENDIEGDFVEEADEVDLKICTFPEDYNKLCYSSTFINNDLLKELVYKPLNVTDMPEKIIINKVVDYYKNPKFQVSIPIINKPLYPYTLITDANLIGKTFIYAGNEIDYEFEKNNITLIEI